jgi:hypothetical protein
MNALFFSALLALLIACAVRGEVEVAEEIRRPKNNKINLGSAASFAVIAGSTVTSSGAIGTVVNGNLGLYPGVCVTGFPPGILNGNLQIANDAGLAAQSDLTVAYKNAKGKAADQVLTADLGGMKLAPGVYKYRGAASLNGVLTLEAGGC